MTVLPCECMEHAGKFLGEHEEAAIGGGLLVAQGVDKAVGGEAGGGDAARDPKVVDLGEEAGDLAPACTLAGLARFADEDNEQIQAVPGGLDHAVRAGPNHVAKGGKELQQNGDGIGLGVGGDGADDAAGEAVGGCRGQCGPGSGSGRGRRWGSVVRIAVAIVVRMMGGIMAGVRAGIERGLPAQQLRSTALYLREGRNMERL